MFLQTDSLAIGKCQQTIVIHHGVHILHPQCINISVKYNVFPLIFISWFVDFPEYI